MQVRPGSAFRHLFGGRLSAGRWPRSCPPVLCRGSGSGSSRTRRSTANRGGSVDEEAGPQLPKRLPPVPRQPQRRASPNKQEVARQSQSSGERTTIRRSDVANKQIITRKEGKRLGRIGCLWVDLRSCNVVSLDCRPPGNVVKELVGSVLPQDVCSVLLGSLRQVGDVVLVQSADALEAEDYSFGYSDIVSWSVRTQGGELLGKVRDFSFSPDTGQISTLIIDMFGNPSIPAAALSTFEVTMVDVLRISDREFTVSDSAMYNSRQLSVGFLDSLLGQLDLAEDMGSGELGSAGSEAARYDQEVAEWRAKMSQYEQQYGPVPREIRQQSPQSRRELASPRDTLQLSPNNGGMQNTEGYRQRGANERSSEVSPKTIDRPEERRGRSRSSNRSRGPAIDEWLAQDGKPRILEDAYSERGQDVNYPLRRAQAGYDTPARNMPSDNMRNVPRQGQINRGGPSRDNRR